MGAYDKSQAAAARSAPPLTPRPNREGVLISAQAANGRCIDQSVVWWPKSTSGLQLIRDIAGQREMLRVSDNARTWGGDRLTGAD